ncbi:MAG: hypothetical protein AAFQ15_12070 [Pseudomonadota bacterium]
MPSSLQAVFGVLLMAVGGLKTWLHIGAFPVLALPTCNGKTLNVALSEASVFEQVHCWGCYAFTVGLGLVLFAGYQMMRERRSVAVRTD